MGWDGTPPWTRSRTDQRRHLDAVVRIERIEEDLDRIDDWQRKMERQLTKFQAHLDTRLDELRDTEAARLDKLEKKADATRTQAFAIMSSLVVAAILLALNLAIK